MHPRRSVPIDEVYVSRAPTNMPSSEGEIITSIFKTAAASPRVRMLTLFWIIGLFCMIWAPAPIQVTEEMKQIYEAKVIDAAHISNYDEVYTEYVIAEEQVADAKVWFWRFRPEYKEIVDARQEIATKAHEKLNTLENAREAKMRDAKAYVGLWSDYGLDEARSRFWAAFESGKMFASRQTFWQMVFSVLQSREENIVSLIFHWAFTALLNFTFGLIGSLFFFSFSLLSMVFTYNPDPFSAIAFIVLALLGGISVIASYLIAIYAMAAGGIYVVGKLAAQNARLRYEQQANRLRHPHQE